MKKYGIIIDLDGTLIHKGKATDGASDFIEYLRSQKIPFRVITNSVGRTQKELSEKVKNVGIEISEEMFLNPITALNHFIEKNKVHSYYFVGPKIIEESLAIASTFEGIPDYVIFSGFENSDYILLNRVFRYLKQGAKLITMSNSEYYITENGPMLDTGAFTRMFEQHAKSKSILFGKPSKKLFLLALEEMNLESSQAIVVGDDVLTDVKGAKALGLYSVLVKTGKYQQDDETKEYPDMLVNTLRDLVGIGPMLNE
jgi:HAD superfamily hydrolase (TIGR01458 family)